MLIKIENGQPIGFPILEDNFKYLHLDKVFPLVLTKEIVEPYGYAMYEFSQQPDIQWNQKLLEATPMQDQYGTWRQQWEVQNLIGEELNQRSEQYKQELLTKIDHDVDQIYHKTIGSRATEYLLAESEAKDYASAGFEGPVPVTVQEWANIKNWPTKETAESVIREADFWRTIQIQLRKTRLETKEKLRVVSDSTQIESIMSQWNTFVTSILEQLAQS